MSRFLRRPTVVALFLSLSSTALPAQTTGLPPAPQPVLAHFGIQAGTVQTLKTPRDRDATTVALYLGGQPVVLEIEPNDVRSEDFTLLADDGVQLRELPRPESITWRGRVRGIPASIVAASIDGHGLRAIVSMGDKAFEIQPVPRALAIAGPTDHVVFEVADILSRGERCDAQSLAARYRRAKPRAFGGLQVQAAGLPVVHEVTLAIDADFELYQFHGSSTTAVANDVATILNGVAAIYEPELQLDLYLGTLVVRTVPTYPGTVTGVLLNELEAEWEANMSGVTRDTCHMFSGVPLPMQGGTGGTAYIGVICHPQRVDKRYGASLVTFGTLASHVGVVAHEIGHNFDANHCDATPDCAIMCAMSGGCTGSLTQFGVSATNEIATHLNTYPCLPIRAADECADAQALVAGVSDLYSDQGSTQSSDPFGQLHFTTDVWFRYVSTQPGPIGISILPTGSAAFCVEAFSGPCGALSPLSSGCATAGGAPVSCTIDAPALPVGTEFYVRVGGIPRGLFRVEITEAFATAVPFGVACGRDGSFFELVPNLAGLANSSLHLTPNANLGYDVSVQPFAWRSTATAVPIWGGFMPNPPFFEGAFQFLPFTFPFPGGSTNRVFLSRDPGEINLGEAGTTYGESFFHRHPRLAPAWGQWGSSLQWVYLEATGSEVFVTWTTFSNNSVQCVMRADGSVEYRYQGNALPFPFSPPIVGFSDGDGAFGDPPVSILGDTPFATIHREPLLLTSTTRPVIGATLVQQVDEIPPGALFGVLAVGFQRFAPALDLSVIGATDCTLLTSIDVTLPFLVSGPTASTSLPLPSQLGLVGLVAYSQALVVDPNFNSLGLGTSNGVTLKLDVN